LSAIGHQGIFRLSGWSRQIHTGFLGPRATWDDSLEFAPFRLRGLHPLCRAFQCPSTMTRIFDSMSACQSRPRGPTTPNMQRLTAITHARFSLIRFRSPLLTESRLLSLPVGTEMFHFPTFPPLALCVQARVTGLASSRVSPFGNPRITVWLSTPRGLSQIPTSFFGSWCQGIHRVPLKTWATNKRCSRPLCSSQHTGGTPTSGVAPTSPTAARQRRRAVRPRGGVLTGVPIQKESSSSPEPSGPNNVPGAATGRRFPLPCVYRKTWPVKAGVVLAARADVSAN
jgi:hypothetical protein